MLLLGMTSLTFAQNLDQIGKAPLVKINGGIAANSVYYSGTANRDPLTYFVNGNLNFNFSGVYNVPLSFSYTNQEFTHSTPFKINRLSIHPSYKWVATHIGDVAMTFSPYTVSGHQFTGFGVDLSPSKPYKVSAFYGRLLRETEYNETEPQAITAFRRMGYGVKGTYEFDRFSVGVIVFKAIDEVKSLKNSIPQSLNLTPKENLVASVESSFKVVKNLSINLEIAQSAITENIIEQQKQSKSHLLGLFIDKNASTDYYTALNTDITYSLGKGSVGVRYERIDPQYRTFGAYFFNNDLENITVNASQELFKGKVSLAVNAGLQRDDLKNEKESQSNRIVSSLNANVKASDKITIGATYSNFQSYTNIRSVFDEINETNPVQNLDTLDFKQVSQNASLQLGYVVSQTKQKQQNLGINFSYQTTKDEQGTAAETNTKTDFYNLGTNYTIAYPEMALTINGAVNATYNTIQGNEALTYGPTVSVNKQFFDKKLRTGFSASYNESLNNGDSQGNVMSYRANAGYVYKEQHNLSLSALSLFRNTSGISNAHDVTVTFGYSYSFDVKKPDLRFKRKHADKETQQKNKDTLRELEEKLKKQNHYRFRYRDEIYEGNALQVVQKIEGVTQEQYFKHSNAFSEEILQTQFSEVRQKALSDDDFKEAAFDYLDEVYLRKDFLEAYDKSLRMALQSLQRELLTKDEAMREAYVKTKDALETYPLHSVKTSAQRNSHTQEEQQHYQKLQKEYAIESERLEAYLYLRFEIDKLLNNRSVNTKSSHLGHIKDRTQESAFEKYSSTQDIATITYYLQGEIIGYFDEKYQNAEEVAERPKK